MTVMDEETIGTLLQVAGSAFTVPATGANDILIRARTGEGGNDESNDPTTTEAVDVVAPTPKSLWGTVRAHKVLSIAASLVLVLALTGGAVWLGNRTVQPKSTTALPSLPGTSKTSHGSTLLAPGSAIQGLAAAGAAGSTGVAAPATPSVGSPNEIAPLPNGTVGQPARIEQTGSLSLRVPRGRLTSVMTKLAFLASAYDGFVANSQTETGTSFGNGPPSGSVTLRVPVNDFSAVLKEAQALGTTSLLTTRATDVTGTYVDLQARITALQASRQQYLTIMTRATSIGDVLAVQSQLDSLQSQIEQLQGQLQVLSSETAYSTLAVMVNESVIVHHHSHHTESGLAKAWHGSVHGFTDGVEGLVRKAGPALFALLCLGVLLLGSRVAWRRLQRHNL